LGSNHQCQDSTGKADAQGFGNFTNLVRFHFGALDLAPDSHSDPVLLYRRVLLDATDTCQHSLAHPGFVLFLNRQFIACFVYRVLTGLLASWPEREEASFSLGSMNFCFSCNVLQITKSKFARQTLLNHIVYSASNCSA